MCMERYLTGMYPGRDWTPVAERMWPWTEQGSWDGCMQRYYTIVPDLVDFIIDLHDPTLHLSRYRRSTEPGREDYEEMTAMFRGDPDDAADRAFCDLLLKDTDFCSIMLMPVWFNDAVEGTCVSGAELTVAHHINELEEILRKHQIALPDMSLMQHFMFGRKQRESGWGEPESTKYLSVILHPEQLK
ncbi:MAG: hypothetical protein J5722_07710 [Oscillospiraceae bacterium]|nr:hypothetical protein [Oscillospiraceae bacterium]